MLFRAIAMSLVLCGLTLLGLAAYSWYDFVSGPVLAVDETDLEVGDSTSEKETEVVFRLVNNSGRPVRVIGMTRCCGVNCRFDPKRSESTFELPPGPSELNCALTPGEAGPFSSQLHLFVDDQGTREIVLTVQGTARAGKSGHP